jgi:hypothetical protein
VLVIDRVARIVFASTFFRFPLGGLLSWALQYLLAIRASGHDVCLVERTDYPDAFFCTTRSIMTDDPSMNLHMLTPVLKKFEIENWRLVDRFNRAYGMSDLRFEEFIRSTDLWIDGGNYGAWVQFVKDGQKSVVIDGEPGYTQIRWETGKSGAPHYDIYFTNGMLLGTPASASPTAGKIWQHVFNPVLPSFYAAQPPRPGSAWTTVMNWQTHGVVEYAGKRYGQKDIEFYKIIELPTRARATFSPAISGNYPAKELRNFGWIVQDAHEVTRTIDTYQDYIYGSRGEVSVCKNVFVDLQTGWFGDRSAAFLAAGRPVILQDTGFSKVLPTGEGLFAFRCIDDILTALDAIESNYPKHSRKARDIAEEYLSAQKVMDALIATALQS